MGVEMGILMKFERLLGEFGRGGRGALNDFDLFLTFRLVSDFFPANSEHYFPYSKKNGVADRRTDPLIEMRGSIYK